MLVIDASVAVCWFAREADTESANRLLLAATQLVAPSLLPVEVANVMWKKFRKGELTRDQAANGASGLGGFIPDVRPAKAFLPGALDLSISLNHAIYDMVYLRMAIELGAMMVTLDRSLLRKLAATPHARHIIHLDDWTPAP